MGNLTRIMSKVAVAEPDDCWLWLGYRDKKGYGKVYMDGRKWLAHRAVYTLLVGPIPDGLDLDHVKARGCVHHHCVNPTHLEPVTNAVNLARGRPNAAVINAAKTECVNGHPYTPENTYMATNRRWLVRRCKQCNRDRANANHAKKRAQRAA